MMRRIRRIIRRMKGITMVRKDIVEMSTKFKKEYIKKIGPRYQKDRGPWAAKNNETLARWEASQNGMMDRVIATRVNEKYGEGTISPDGTINVDGSFAHEVGQNLPHVAIGWVVGSIIGLFIPVYFIVIPVVKAFLNIE